MNCEKFQTIAPELAREQMMEAADRAAALQHAGACRSCATVLKDERSLTAGFNALRAEAKEIAAPSSMEAKMMAAFRERQQAKPITSIRTRRANVRYWAAAIAAMVILTLGFFVLRARFADNKTTQVAGTDPKPAVENVTRASAITATPVDPVRAPTIPAKQGPRKNTSRFVAVKHAPRPTTAIGNTTAAVADNRPTSQQTGEVATGFFPIGYTTTPNLQEGGQLLRVELPRAAVARFGLPVNMERAGERVKADVLVGADGLPQAIRFVQ
jgi:hypothetical protein